MLFFHRLDSNLVLKISIFGLTRDMYNNDYYRMEENSRWLPIRWMSPEAIMEDVLSVQSNVVRILSAFLTDEILNIKL